jgi:hypothetical protein
MYTRHIHPFTDRSVSVTCFDTKSSMANLWSIHAMPSTAPIKAYSALGHTSQSNTLAHTADTTKGIDPPPSKGTHHLPSWSPLIMSLPAHNGFSPYCSQWYSYPTQGSFPMTTLLMRTNTRNHTSHHLPWYSYYGRRFFVLFLFHKCSYSHGLSARHRYLISLCITMV